MNLPVGLLKQPFDYRIEGNLPEAIPLNMIEKYSLGNDKAFRSNNITLIAKATEIALENIPHRTAKEADNPKVVTPVKTFIQISKKEDPGNESLKKLERTFTAFKLGIPVQALDEKINPGFPKFAKESSLYRYLAVYNHQLKVAKNGKIQILHEGKMVPWKQVMELALAATPALKEKVGVSNLPRKYTHTGLINGNFYNWVKLEHYIEEECKPNDPPYVFVICSLAQSTFRKTGDHSFAEIWYKVEESRDGKLCTLYRKICFGPYRENNNGWEAFSLLKTLIQSPDCSVFWPEEIFKTSFAISKEAFDAIKSKVESDHQNEHLPFDLVSRNCTRYVLDLAEIAGIAIPMKIHFLDNFIYGKLQELASSLTHRLPRPIKWTLDQTWKVDQRLLGVGVNIGRGIFGGTKVSPNLLKGSDESFKAPIHSISDLFDPLESQSPYMLAYQLKPEVEEERRKEANGKRKREEIPIEYRVPSKYLKQENL